MGALGILTVAALAAEVPAPAPCGPVPTARQLAWHRMERYAFIHFGPNTFTDREWGDGAEHPDVFAPTQLDCRQWARVLKGAGFEMIMVTAKHHDGFCLWPSKFSTHTVAQSAWRGGKGDVLKELSEACREQGLRFGVYLSPWDRNHPNYGTPQYNETFKNMLSEVLTRYGKVSEVWFDGANGEGPNGKRQVYDWPGFIATVRHCQPGAVIFSDAGPDVRWVGNEAGHSSATCWSTLRRDEFYPGTPDYAQLTEGHKDGTHWVPAECDVSIRPGWFYRGSEDPKVKSLQDLIALYYGSVGQNAPLLLNVPPDRRGLLAEPDVAVLEHFGDWLRRTFATNLAKGARVEASNVRGGARRFAPSNALTERSAYWAADDGVTSANLTVKLKGASRFDQMRLREAIELGQRVERFSIHALVEGGWKQLAEGTTIGWNRIVRFEPVVASRVRITIEAAKACPTLRGVGVFLSAPR